MLIYLGDIGIADLHAFRRTTARSMPDFWFMFNRSITYIAHIISIIFVVLLFPYLYIHICEILNMKSLFRSWWTIRPTILDTRMKNLHCSLCSTTSYEVDTKNEFQLNFYWPDFGEKHSWSFFDCFFFAFLQKNFNKKSSIGKWEKCFEICWGKNVCFNIKKREGERLSYREKP